MTINILNQQVDKQIKQTDIQTKRWNTNNIQPKGGHILLIQI